MIFVDTLRTYTFYSIYLPEKNYLTNVFIISVFLEKTCLGLGFKEISKEKSCTIEKLNKIALYWKSLGVLY